MRHFVLFLLATSAAAQTVNLQWTDCGDADTHAKITDFSPTTVTIGQKTTLTAVSDIDEDIPDATFEVVLKGMGITLMDCKGDGSVAKECDFPLGSGSLTFDGMALPVKAGKGIKTTTELLINSMSGMSSTTTITNISTSSGDKVSCIQVVSSMAPVLRDNCAAPECDVCCDTDPTKGLCLPCKACTSLKDGPCAPCWVVNATTGKACLADDKSSCQACWADPPLPHYNVVV